MLGSEPALLNNQVKEIQYARASKSALMINTIFKLPFTTAELPGCLSSLLVGSLMLMAYSTIY